MKLSPRLQMIADFVEKGSIVADIGTDHAYIPVYLVKNGIASKAIAADVNKGPLDSAKEYISKNKLNNMIETRLGDGLEVIQPGEVDTVIIAGMGGLLIRDILDNNKAITNSIKKLVLQPMVASQDLRRYLYSNGFKIEDEKLAREKDRFYEIFTVVHGYEEINNDVYYEIGKKLIENNDELLKDFLKKKINSIEKILENFDDEKTSKSEKRYQKLKKRHNDIMEVLNTL